MIVFLRFSKIKKYISIIVILFFCLYGIYFWNNYVISTNVSITNHANQDLEAELQQIFDDRNEAYLKDNLDILTSIYNQEARTGLWAYEHELRKIKYLNEWINKQAVIFDKVESKVFLGKTQEKQDGYIVNLSVTTEYVYKYKDLSVETNSFRICTYHTIELISKENNWMINNEWYRDPLANTLGIDKMDLQKINEVILSGKVKDISNLNDRRQGALNYANEYCGVARPPDYSFQYNNNYKNYNSLGGNCANFASQVLYEGGGFSKTLTWNYVHGEGSKAWVNAHAFNSYMLYSGRASLIAKGTYEQVLNSSYEFLPGDYIGYEKNGKVAHISVISGIDSKGYALVNCHNSDRYRVPWDLGWSGEKLIFWLVRVNY